MFYPKGSEWRKWDLHIHTPETALNDQFTGSSLEKKWDSFIDRIDKSDIQLFGITDYCSIDNYIKLLDLLAKRPSRTSTVFFPNLEFRANFGADDKFLNVHFIFSPEVADEIPRFLGQIGFEYRGTKYVCTRNDLIAFGKAHLGDNGVPETVAYKKGVEQFKINFTEVTNFLKNDTRFSNKYLIAVPNSSRDGASCIQKGSGEALREEIYRAADIIFAANASTISFFRGEAGPNNLENLNNKCGGKKPCFSSSDAHSIDKVGSFSDNKVCWVKADPTFDGLRQVCIELDRVYVGDKPPAVQRVESNPTRIITNLQVQKKSDATCSEDWFDFDLPLNPFLVSIIGNKGMGKSALADIIALCGGINERQRFSFLTEKRFCAPKQEKAKSFWAKMEFADSRPSAYIPLNALSEQPIQTVKYIPQHYLESICTEIDEQESGFHVELNNAIFSHIPNRERLGTSTLRALREHLFANTNQRIGQFKKKIHSINTQIAELELEQSPETKRKNETWYYEKVHEMAMHKTTRPMKVDPPSTTALSPELQLAIESKRKDELILQRLVKRKKRLETSLDSLIKKNDLVRNIEEKIKILRENFDTELREIKNLASQLSIEAEKLVSINVDDSSLKTIKKKLSEQKRKLELFLDPSSSNRLSKRSLMLSQRIDTVSKQIGQQQVLYTEYLRKIEDWKAQRKTIIGQYNIPGSLLFYRKKVRGVKKDEAKLQELYADRLKVVRKIAGAKKHMQILSKKHYAYVEKFLESHALSDKFKGKFTINSKLTINNFATNFANKISKRGAWTYYGKEEASERLNGYEGQARLEKIAEVVDFCLEVHSSLHSDMRAGKNEEKTYPHHHLAQNATLVELYDYLFSLDYITPEYSLSWDQKALENLSPGERGCLLLIFFLIVDKDDLRPIILDQPEENLDNQTIYDTLVPCIKYAKNNRQVIIVTHNPNLAVVCDSEQIIYCEIQKNNNFKASYLSGSIESLEINRKLVDILEGTFPAFRNRDDKYITLHPSPPTP